MKKLTKLYELEKEENTTRVYFFDNLKYVLILLVILGHLFEIYYDKSNVMKAGFNFIYLFHMPLFILISGYFSKKFKPEKILNFFLLCFLSLFLIRTLETLFLNKPFNYNFLSFQSASWYLFVLAIYNITLPLIKSLKKQYVIAFSVLFALYVGYVVSVKDLFIASRIIVFYPFFLLGYYASLDDIKKVVKPKYFLISLLGIITIFLLFYFFKDLYVLRGLFTGRNSYKTVFGDYYIYGGFIRLIYYIASLITMIMVMNIVPKCKMFLSKYGARTLQIYILQMYFLFFIRNTSISSYLYKTGVYLPIVLLLLAFLLSILLGNKVFSKPFDYLSSLKWKFLKVENNQ